MKSQPPRPLQVSWSVEHHGVRLEDPYRWLHERESEAVRQHLAAENAYADAVLAPHAAIKERLYDEMLARIVEDDVSVAAKEGPFWYFTRTESGRAYPIYCRRANEANAPEQVVLDVNLLAEGRDYTEVGACDTSPSHRLLAYSVDHEGSERYRLCIKDLETGRLLPDVLQDVAVDVAWADDETLLYLTLDDQERPHQVWCHQLGRPRSEDVLIFDEPDGSFYVGVERSRNQSCIYILLESAVTSEVWLVDPKAPTAPPRVVRPREPGIEYEVDHGSSGLFIRTNLNALDFRMMTAPLETPDRWTEMIPARPGIMLETFEVFSNHLVLWERQDGLPQIRVIHRSEGATHTVVFDEAAFDVWPTGNLEYETDTLRFGYTSMVTPTSVFDYHLDDRTRVLKKQIEVPGYHQSDYVTERQWAVAPDGVRVPISLVRRKDLPLDQTARLLLLGYGAYGDAYDPGFDSRLLSLLDRGFVVAIAHVRGGGELGRAWKDAGKLAQKPNTFLDFIAGAEALVEQGYTSFERIAIEGSSAGGLLVGAVLNLRPELCRVALTSVPFVDPLHTLLDETLPLTVLEWEEWGDPTEPEAFSVISKYAPFDNVHSAPYPHLFVTAGFHDSRVPYWEAAKWVARLRAHQTQDRVTALKVDMGTGHGGKSGRYAQLEEQAEMYTFLLAHLSMG